MLFQPSNIYPSTLSGIGAGTVDVTQGLNVSWQVNGDTPMTAYQVRIYQNDSASTLMYDSGSVSVSPAFETHDKYGNPTFYTFLISAAALSSAGIVNGYANGYKMLIKQWWSAYDYVEQTSASVFITRSLPTLSIDAIANPVASSSVTITATYAQAQGDPISTVEWIFALAGSESNPIRRTGAVNTQILSFDADGLITGNTYSIMCNVVTANGMEASTGFVQFSVSYQSSFIDANYTLAQMKNSSAVYLSLDNFGTNILEYPYSDSTKTTNGITFTVNGEGNISASGTASADAKFKIAEGTLSALGFTAGQKLLISSGNDAAKIQVTETTSGNVLVSTLTGGNPLQYIVPNTTNTVAIFLVIPAYSAISTAITLSPMICEESKIVGVNDLSVELNPVQSGSGTPSTSNVRPISGHTGVTVSNDPVMGETIGWTQLAALDAAKWSTIRATMSFSGAKTTITPSTSASSIKQAGFDLQNGHYYLVSGKYITSESNRLLTIGFYYGSMGSNTYDERKQISYVADGPDVSFSMAFHCQRNDQQFRLALASAATTSEYATVENLQVYDLTAIFPTRQDRVWWIYNDELATEGAGLADFRTIFPKDYYGYNPGTSTCVSDVNDSPYWKKDTDWTSIAGTVYGCIADLVTGTLTVTRTNVDLSSLTWTTIATGSTRKSLSVNVTSAYPSANPKFIASHYVYKGLSSSASLADPDSFDVGLYAYNGVNGYATSVYLVIPIDQSPMGTLVYSLYTPTSYQIPKQDLSLLVENKLWCDTGELSVSYTNKNNSQTVDSGWEVWINDSKAVDIAPPIYVPLVTGVSLYRYIDGEPYLHYVCDSASGTYGFLDYYAPSQSKISYLVKATTASGDVFVQTKQFTPVFWFYSILLCDEDSDGIYHVSKEYKFKYGVETGAVSNNNSPTMQTNFTPYPNRQPISSLYKTGKLTGYIGTVDKMNVYSDSVALQNAIYAISTSTLTKFLKTRKGDVILVDTSGAIQMQTEDKTVEQALKATIEWAEIGSTDQTSIVSIPSDTFWPL